ncbi:STAS domain-containing protein [Paracoccus sp. MC1854]|uniref:STAS domain-containing protein n=1 Tax=Paracoccus sp. MC1854 TaxID=2760306 RepID=UPI0016001249|nr:STAS domain-containing protein [Paracoccus sp. MC1854]MBB1491492.1 STAS domain-containing protein [Paracoccus sp. MC1854]
MNITIEEIEGGVRARVGETRLDAAISIRFKDRLREIMSRHGPCLLLDLSMVTFMDSSGLGAILAIRRALPPGHRIELAGLTPNVDRVFRLTRMDLVFTIHGSATDAVAQAEGTPS